MLICVITCSLGEESRARAALEKSLSLDRNHVPALFNLANLQRDAGEYEGAIEGYGRVLALNRADWRAMLNRAVALQCAGRGAEARQDYKKAFKQTKRVDIYDHMRDIKRVARHHKKHGTATTNAAYALSADDESSNSNGNNANGTLADSEDQLLAAQGGANFRCVAPEHGSSPAQVGVALSMRNLQRETRLGPNCTLEVSKFAPHAV
eukprot:jgi/Chlat1/2138/Chrsp17S02720